MLGASGFICSLVGLRAYVAMAHNMLHEASRMCYLGSGTDNQPTLRDSTSYA